MATAPRSTAPASPALGARGTHPAGHSLGRGAAPAAEGVSHLPGQRWQRRRGGGARVWLLEGMQAVCLPLPRPHTGHPVWTRPVWGHAGWAAPCQSPGSGLEGWAWSGCGVLSPAPSKVPRLLRHPRGSPKPLVAQDPPCVHHPPANGHQQDPCPIPAPQGSPGGRSPPCPPVPPPPRSGGHPEVPAHPNPGVVPLGARAGIAQLRVAQGRGKGLTSAPRPAALCPKASASSVGGWGIGKQGGGCEHLAQPAAPTPLTRGTPGAPALCRGFPAPGAPGGMQPPAGGVPPPQAQAHPRPWVSPGDV